MSDLPGIESDGRSFPETDPEITAAFHAHRDDPIRRFEGLLVLARKDKRQRQPTALSLSTVDAEGRPSSRIVLLKGVDASGFVFYTNLESRKGREALARPDVALCFYWEHLDVMVRVEGRATRVSDGEADAYFAGRPRGSQLGAWASQQSDVLSSRAQLEARLVEVSRCYEGGPVPRPPHWSGLRVQPRAMEFWRNRESRLHDREQYLRTAEAAPWTLQLLYP